MRPVIAVDVETYDPTLHDLGDGSCAAPLDGEMGTSKLLCVGTFDGEKAEVFIPFTPSWSVFESMMLDDSTDKVFHNGTYDLAWLYCRHGILPRGFLHDTMTRMTYIDEYAELSLDACCATMHVQGKNKSETIEAWWESHKDEIVPKLKAQGVLAKKSDALWKHSAYLFDEFPDFREAMMEYNKQDCRATYNLYFAQEPRLKSVYDAYMVDVKLTPLIMQMKKQGVLIDRKKLQELTAEIEQDRSEVQATLETMYGVTPEMIASPKQLTKRLNEMGIHSPILTAKGAESFSAPAFDRLHHPVISQIQDYKALDALLSKYLQGNMAAAVLSDNRIHCTFKPNKREEGGTVTGRFACSSPNLQNIVQRDKMKSKALKEKHYGQRLRGLFIPEQGCMMGAFDYSQIEYLLLAHFAVGEQAEWFRAQANAGVDFHTVAMDATGIPERNIVKTFNYGVIYGMGWRKALDSNWSMFEKMAAAKGVGLEEFVHAVYDDYHARLPVIRDTMKYVEGIARMNGYVKTIGGRLQHKPRPQYDPATGKMQDFIYKMLNKLIQGSAADILKFSMLECYEKGLFDVLTMHLTVHDENVVSIPYNKEGTEAAMEMKRTMDMSFHNKLLVPMKAAAEVGPDWGYWNHDIWDDMCTGTFNRANECWWGV